MAYRNKIYVTFDADSDIRHFYLMKAWKENVNIEFEFNDAHQIHAQGSPQTEEYVKQILRERLDNTKCMVVLVGERTRFMYKYVHWELEQAIYRDIPIIAVYLNGNRTIDETLCPPIIRDQPVVHISYNSAIIKHALENWPSYYHNHKRDGKNRYYYNQNTYKSLGL